MLSGGTRGYSEGHSEGYSSRPARPRPTCRSERTSVESVPSTGRCVGSRYGTEASRAVGNAEAVADRWRASMARQRRISSSSMASRRCCCWYSVTCSCAGRCGSACGKLHEPLAVAGRRAELGRRPLPRKASCCAVCVRTRVCARTCTCACVRACVRACTFSWKASFSRCTARSFSLSFSISSHDFGRMIPRSRCGTARGRVRAYARACKDADDPVLRAHLPPCPEYPSSRSPEYPSIWLIQIRAWRPRARAVGPTWYSASWVCRCSCSIAPIVSSRSFMRTASSACAVRDCTLHAARHAVARGLQQCRRGGEGRVG